MPIDHYDGDTFVAYTDISGFKEKMKSPKEAGEALESFYSEGYNILGNQRDDPKINGIFISDCGILFVRLNDHSNEDIINGFVNLLTIIKELNIRMARRNLLLTTSVAYGDFQYQNRSEFVGIEKSLLVGNAYLQAFLDNENGVVKLSPGYCRIVNKHLPNDIEMCFRNESTLNRYPLLTKLKKGGKYHYFY